MKRCPVCHALAFEDSKKCYGCLHDFDEDDSTVLQSDLGFEPEKNDERTLNTKMIISDPCLDKIQPVEMTLRLYPHIGASGELSWSFSCDQSKPAWKRSIDADE